MSKSNKYRPYLIRLGIITLICLVFTILFNEITYAIQKESYDRKPEVIQITIPKGTASQIAAGQMASTIPAGLIFVAGDVLEVKNEDVTSHQLGPLWVPAGATASLAMDEPTTAAYSCSFRPNQYLDIDVRRPTVWTDRLIGITLGAPTLTVLVFLYSLAAAPIDGKSKKKPGKPEPAQEP